MHQSTCYSRSLSILLVGGAVAMADGAVAQQAFQDYVPTWAPDGQRIAFMRQFAPGHSDIFVVDVKSGALTRLTNRVGEDRVPTWSPTGDLIAFCSDRGGQNDIFVMAPDGTGLRNVTNHPAGECDAAWSPDGTRLAVTSDRNGNRDIFLVDLRGAAPPVQLTTSTGYDLVIAGGWSPDGSRIIFCSAGEQPVDESAPDAYDGFALYVIDAIEGATPRMLVDLPGEDSYASWSPDGRTVLFSHQSPFGEPRETLSDIYEADAAGSNVRPLIVGPGQQFNQAVSPDGRSIAYHSWESSDNGAIWLANRDGTGRRQLTNR